MSNPGFLQRISAFFGITPTAKDIAKQLRHPKGKLGDAVAKKMNEGNEFLYDFTLETMNLQDRDRLMEIGFGNGKFFDKIFSKANNLKICGIDYSELMVRSARLNNSLAIEAGNLEICYSNSEALPFDSNTFDKIFSINVIYFWEKPNEILEEIYRVLKPGGLLFTSIRLKDSMINLPFTQFGFKLYNEAEWKDQLIRSHFIYNEGFSILEPEFELNETKLQLESICMVARKPF